MKYTGAAHQPNPVVTGALFAGLLALIIIAGLVLPFGIFILLLSPVAVVVTSVRAGIQTGVIAATGAGLLLALVLGPFKAVTLAGGSGLVGLSMGLALRRKYSPRYGVMAAGAGFVLTLVGAGLAFWWLTGTSPLQAVSNSLASSREAAIELYRQMGHEEDVLQRLNQAWDQAMAQLWLVFPTVVGVTIAVFSLFNYLLAGTILGRMGVEVRPLPPFADWRFPPAIVLGYALGFLGIWLKGRYDIAQLYPIGLNLYLIFTLAFAVEGMALVYYYLVKADFPRWSRILLLLTLLVVPVLPQATVWLGMADLAFDFRRLKLPFARRD